MSPVSHTQAQVGGNGVSPPAALSNNQIVSNLPATELSSLMERVEDISVELRDGFFEDGETIKHVYFPLTGMASLVTVLEDGTMVEAMTIGREGFLGLPVFHGAKVSGLKSMCQIGGDFLRMTSKDFLEVLEDSPELRGRLLRYSEFAHQVLAQWSACNGIHLIEQRCARWLLVTADAVGSSTFNLTQEFLSQMLSVRRPGVTAAMGGLERRGLVGHRYGKVAILDEAGLRKVSCECYGRIREKAAVLLV
jgi:CRP-like cAMP-binding protein